MKEPFRIFTTFTSSTVWTNWKWNSYCFWSGLVLDSLPHDETISTVCVRVEMKIFIQIKADIYEESEGLLCLDNFMTWYTQHSSSPSSIHAFEIPLTGWRQKTHKAHVSSLARARHTTLFKNPNQNAINLLISCDLFMIIWESMNL